MKLQRNPLNNSFNIEFKELGHNLPRVPHKVSDHYHLHHE
jgi:hypothetical protein